MKAIAKDFGFATFKYDNGVSTIKSSMGDYGGYLRRHLLINGDKGALQIMPLEKYSPKGLNTITTTYIHYDNVDWNSKGKEKESKPFGRYEEMFNAFAKMIKGKAKYQVDLETEAVIHRCLLSACGIPCDYKKKITLE